MARFCTDTPSIKVLRVFMSVRHFNLGVTTQNRVLSGVVLLLLTYFVHVKLCLFKATQPC